MQDVLRINQPPTLVFGAGCVQQCAADLVARQAHSVFVVTSPPTRNLGAPLFTQLRAEGVMVTVWDGIAAEPSMRDFRAAVAAAREVRADAVVGLGGGSAMDVAKLVAAFLDGRQEIDSAFGIGHLQGRTTYLACLPTTAGTGSEVSPIAILLDEQDDLKKGVVSSHLVPDASYVDPLLTISMPPAITAATGIDAFTHCVESFANRFAHPFVDTYALEGIRLVARSLVRAVEQGDDIQARSDMALASLYGGFCLGPVNTAAVHALSYPLGGEFHVAHGVSNALLLPHVLEFNLPAAPARYAKIAQAMGESHSSDDLETARRGIERIRELCRRCGLPAHMAEFGIGAADIDRMARSALTVQRLLQRNVREVTEADAREIYRKAL